MGENNVSDNADIVEADYNKAFDYTKWQRKHYDAMTPEEISAEAKRYNSERPFKGKKAVEIR